MLVRILATLFAAMALAAAAQAQQTVLEVITLKYRNAEQVIPVLQPLMAPQGTLTGLNNRLVVRTTPANLAEIKQVLATIDAAPRRLVISVRQDADLVRTVRGGEISGEVAIGDNAAVSVPGRPTPPGATARAGDVRAKVYSSQSAKSDRVSQQVQVLEGTPALIRVGQSQQVIQTPSGPQVIYDAQYVEANSGFYVVARVSGDQVTLDISSADDRLQNQRRGTVDIQHVNTVVSGRLGEWIELGAIGQEAMERDNALIARSTDAARGQRRVLVKVDEVR